jgi:hypothetical protein
MTDVPLAVTSMQDDEIVRRLHEAAVDFANAAAIRLPAHTADDLLQAVDRSIVFTVAVEITPPGGMALIMTEGDDEPKVLMRIERRPDPADVN